MNSVLILVLCTATFISAQNFYQRRAMSTTTATRPTTTTSPPKTTQTRVQAKVNIRANPRVQSVAGKSPVRSLVREAGSAPLQNENPWAALENMRGRGSLSAEEIQIMMENSVPGVDFPTMSAVPEQTRIRCDQMRQPGFYADVDFQCQVFRRCDQFGNIYGFVCPNTTLFNQITLTCDYFFNVDCSKSQSYYDYSNSRLYHENWLLLGN